MKKEWKAIDICWGILFVLSAVLGSWVGQSPVFAATDQEVAQVILHKKSTFFTQCYSKQWERDDRV